MKLKDLEELEKRATPGPWYPVSAVEYSYTDPCWRPHYKVDGADREYTVSNDPASAGWETDGGMSAYCISKADAELIAAVRNALPALIEIAKAAGVVELIQEEEN